MNLFAQTIVRTTIGTYIGDIGEGPEEVVQSEAEEVRNLLMDSKNISYLIVMIDGNKEIIVDGFVSVVMKTDSHKSNFETPGFYPYTQGAK